LVFAKSTLPEFFDGHLPSRLIYTTSMDSIGYYAANVADVDGNRLEFVHKAWNAK
jgi:hypothetical protein